MTIFTVYLVVWPHDWFITAFEFEMTGVERRFRFIMVALALINFLLSFVAESFIVDYIVFLKLKEWVKSKGPSTLPYDKIYNETHNLNWLKPYQRSYASTGELNDNSNQKITAYETKNGYVKFGGDVIYKNNVDGNGRTSPAESGVYVNSPASAPLTPSGTSGGDSSAGHVGGADEPYQAELVANGGGSASTRATCDADVKFTTPVDAITVM